MNMNVCFFRSGGWGGRGDCGGEKFFGLGGRDGINR